MAKVDFSLKVVFAADLPPCELCGEPWCPLHREHYADCPCPGPDSEPNDAVE